MPLSFILSAGISSSPSSASLTTFQFQNQDDVRPYEGGANDAYSLILTRISADSVAVDIDFDSSRVTLNGSSSSPLTLEFRAQDLNVPRVIQVGAVDDSTPLGGVTANLPHTARDSVGSFSIGTVVASLVDNDLRIFATVATRDGNVGGISEADNVCMSDLNKPSSGVYKAMLVHGLDRRACSSVNCSAGVGENIDWVFRANQPYTRAGTSTVILTTNNAGIHDFGGGDITNAFVAGSFKYWTGLQTNWTTNPSTCSGWTDNSGGPTSSEGAGQQTDSNSISDDTSDCDTSQRLICVEQ